MNQESVTLGRQRGKTAPASEAELACFLTESCRRSTPLCIEGGGTRVEVNPAAADQIVSTQGLTGIVTYEPGELILIARSGTPMKDIEETLAAEGQCLAFEPMESRSLLKSSGTSTIGGMVAGNVSGPRRILAGACRDYLLGLRFVDGRGRIIRSGGRVMKNVTGLDLGKLLCGSYGTLGVVTEVALKTLPIAPSQETIAFRGVSARAAVDIFAAALATPYEVSGAAFSAGTAWLRIEGLGPQVAYRRHRLSALFEDRQIDVIPEPESRELWRRLRDVEHFSEDGSPLWKVHVKPSDASAAVSALERLGGRTSMDWGGGLIWYASDVDAAAVRAALPNGHATLIRRGRLPMAETFQPKPAPIAALSAALRQTFDPAGILNPGLMGL